MILNLDPIAYVLIGFGFGMGFAAMWRAWGKGLAEVMERERWHCYTNVRCWAETVDKEQILWYLNEKINALERDGSGEKLQRELT